MKGNTWKFKIPFQILKELKNSWKIKLVRYFKI